MEPDSEHSTSLGGETGERLNGWLGTLRDPHLERLFRLDALPMARSLGLFGMVGCALGTIGFFVVDLRLFAGSDKLAVLAIVRAIYVALTTVLAILLYRNRSSVRYFDGLMSVWGIMTIAFVLWISTTRPPDFVQHSIVSAGLVILFFAFVRTPFLVQAVMAALLVAGESVLLVILSDPDLATSPVFVLLSFFVAGSVAAWLYHTRERAQFVALLGERKTRAELQRALADVQRLQSLLSMCPACKKIKDENGEWRHVEAYVRDHTGTEFVHGLCPQCAAKLAGTGEDVDPKTSDR